MRTIIAALGIVVMLAGSAVAAEFVSESGRTFGWQERERRAGNELFQGGAGGEAGDASADAAAEAAAGPGNSGNGNGEGDSCSR